MGFLSGPKVEKFEPEPVRTVDDDAVRAAGEAEADRRRKRRGGLATLLTGTGGGAGDLKAKTGG